MVLYLLKSAACLAAFMALYKMLLEREPMHHLKRFYLLAAVMLSFIIPQIVFVEYVELPPTTFNYENSFNTSETTTIIAPEKENPWEWWQLVLPIYLAGCLFFTIRFIIHLRTLIKNIRNNPKIRTKSWVNVLLEDFTAPHTFLHYIFLSREGFENKAIPNEVLLHEAAHVKQKHSLDVLLMELLQIAFWFNPLIFILKNWIKLNHEFLADHAVIKQGTPAKDYQHTLLKFASSATNHHQLNRVYSSIGAEGIQSIKKRFIIMKKRKSTTSVVLRSFAAVPLLAALVIGFSEQVTVVQPQTPPLEIQVGASALEIETYNNLATKYNAIPLQERKIPLNDLRTLEVIFKKMSPRQKEEAQPFPECFKGNNQQQTVDLIEIAVNKNGKLLVGNQLVELEDLKSHLKQLNTANTFEEREKSLRVVITADKNAPKVVLEQIDAIISDFGAATVNIMEHRAYAQETSITKKELKEYNSLARRYNKMLDKEEGIQILKKDVDRMEYLFNNMSEKQRATAEPFPALPEPPKPPLPPNAPAPPQQPKAPLPPNEASEVEEEIVLAVEVNENVIEEILIKKNASDTEYANYQIEKIVESQEIYDELNPIVYSIKDGTKEEIRVQTSHNYYSPKDEQNPLKDLETGKPTLKLTLFDAPYFGPETTPDRPSDLFKKMVQNCSKIWYKGKIISKEEGLDLLKKHKYIQLVKHETPHDVPSMTLDELE
ncbi:M56 family metallopeptidase [Euzebyella saccharophila]|uniref:M56 family metallopeptidase n=1 Tax=Euzebyella saccharophila TaxID=679664 RepID=A0ABV8JNN0_9FLAO|nr:M56 family metallopeptidase [Euzebyella saccharophila]